MSWIQPLAGAYTYRGFRNDPVPVAGNPALALALLLAEGDLVVEVRPDPDVFRATLTVAPDEALDLSGRVELSFTNQLMTVTARGLGRPGTRTAGWVYDFSGAVCPRWPAGVGQVLAVVGTVLRSAAHAGAPAGAVASFVAVKRADAVLRPVSG